MLDDRPTVALAIFPPEKYTGTITTDLFAEDETSYFDDAEQFFSAAKRSGRGIEEAPRGQRRVGRGDGGLPPLRLAVPQGQEEPERRRPYQSLAFGPVEIREGLVRPKIEKETAEAIAENPIAPVKVKAAYSAPLCRYIAHHKTAAVAEILLASPRTAQEVLIVRTLKGFRLHEAFAGLGKEAEPQSAYRVLEEQARGSLANSGSTSRKGSRCGTVSRRSSPTNSPCTKR